MLDAGMRKRWRIRSPDGQPPPALVDAFARQIGVQALTARLLLLRDIESAPEADRFRRPKLTHLHDPASLPGVDHAAKRLKRAVEQGERIVIYGDYDVDGITATAILWHTLRLAGAEVSTYVPHRLNEGYGLNEQALRQLATGSRPVVVTVDCGITATGPARVARQLGLDLIITDHHAFDPADLPEAYALVHPRLVRGTHAYPFADLCGAGVAFKLAWQFATVHCGSQRVTAPFRELLMDLLSLVALGTVADVAPLVDENRTVTVFGLERLKHTRFHGLNALIDAARLRHEKIDAYHVGFALGPRLNACGRMGHAEQAVHLLTTAGPEDAERIVKLLSAENDRRRAIERSVFADAKQMVLDSGQDRPESRAIVLAKPGWHRGVLGIVASRLVEAFSRPVVLMTEEQGWCHGSARSVEQVPLDAALGACANLVDRFGGHAIAAGLVVKTERLAEFHDALVRYANEHLSPEELIPVLKVDAEVALGDCTLECFEQIGQLAPFGRGNPTPQLLLRDITLDQPAQRIGQAGQHLSLTLRQNGPIWRAVGFGHGQFADQLPGGAVIDAIVQPRVSNWRGIRRPELHLQDFKHASAVANGLPVALTAAPS